MIYSLKKKIFPGSAQRFSINGMEGFISKRDVVRIAIGLIGLLTGAFVYIVSRPPEQIYFVHKLGINISLYKLIPNIFGPLSANLPTFFHPFAFILIIAGLLSTEIKGSIIISIAWLITCCVFELAQKYNSFLLRIIPAWFNKVPILENTGNYFIHGTFDIRDILAIVAGSVAALFILLLTKKRSVRIA